MEEDKEFLEWIYLRMINLYNENENTDYMIKFKKIMIDDHFSIFCLMKLYVENVEYFLLSISEHLS